MGTEQVYELSRLSNFLMRRARNILGPAGRLPSGLTFVQSATPSVDHLIFQPIFFAQQIAPCET